MNWEVLDWSIVGPALVGGLLVLSTHVPLGQMVLKRGIIFIDLALAQVAGLGVIAAAVFSWDNNRWIVQISAVSAALIAGGFLRWTEKRWPNSQEALIGTLFVLAATGSILLLAENPHGGEHLKDLLVGQILWTTWSMLLPIGLVSAVFFVACLGFRERMAGLGFYIAFAFVVTASVQIVGVYLVFASLIIPALSTRRLSGTRRIYAGYLIGALSYLVGIVLSAMADLPTGAVIVWTMALISIAAGFLIAHRVPAVGVKSGGPSD